MATTSVTYKSTLLGKANWLDLRETHCLLRGSTMAIIPTPNVRLLVKPSADREKGLQLLSDSGAGAMYVHLTTAGIKATPAAVLDKDSWLTAVASNSSTAEHPWDLAHQYLTAQMKAAAPDAVEYVEPDFLQAFVYMPMSFTGASDTHCEGKDFQGDWPSRPMFGWHLTDEYAQLKAARETIAAVAITQRVRIGHLDTGYSDHDSKPEFLRAELGWNFVDNIQDTHDPAVHMPGDNPGHGTGTLGILAGNRIQHGPLYPFDDFLGGAPLAEVIPIRIANSVVHFWTSGLAQGIEYAAAHGCDVVSISMGGIPTQRWADAVNNAYESGVAIFAAGGNSVGGFPTHYLVYPARFKRVTAVCGATADKTPYWRDGYDKMEGNWGPEELMGTAITAYSPNIPWSVIGCKSAVDMDGSGTSAATPQAAAAAALYIQKNYAALHAPAVQPWQRVEAVRQALFASADKTAGNVAHFGNGLLRASVVLEQQINLPNAPAPRDAVDFALVKELFGWQEMTLAQQQMIQVEAAQLTALSPNIEQLYDGADPASNALDKTTRKKVVQQLASRVEASQTMRSFLTEAQKKL